MEKKTLKKHEIILKSMGLLHRKGYNGTGIQAIADAAGIPKGSFYNYFNSKEDFVIEILNWYGDERSSQFKRVLGNAANPPRERIMALYRDLIKGYEDSGMFSMGSLVSKICHEMAENSDPIRDAATRLYEKIKAPLEKCLKEAKKEGWDCKGIEPAYYAEFFLSSWYGALVQMKSTGNTRPLKVYYKIMTQVLLS